MAAVFLFVSPLLSRRAWSSLVEPVFRRVSDLPPACTYTCLCAASSSRSRFFMQRLCSFRHCWLAGWFDAYAARPVLTALVVLVPPSLELMTPVEEPAL
ncbi:hypothetical protein BKA80DRAFT_264883 [Phyllosticta citrichinensis]